MNIASMNKQAVTGTEAVKAGTVDNKARKSEAVSAIQNSKVDLVELSDRAVELSRVADTDTSSREEPTTDQDQEQVTAEAESISVLA